MINHYSAFHETIKANSATGTIPYLSQHSFPLEIHQKIPEISSPSTTIEEPENAKPDIIIAVIPAYNEALSIGSVVLSTRRFVDHVIVVDDGSSDETSIIAQAAGAEVITLTGNGGKARAMMKGFERARKFNPMAVVMLDGDGQHNPAEIPTILKPVLAGQADLVIGSRFLINGNNIPRYRMLGQKTLDLATHMSSGYASTDSQSGFRAISRKGLENLTFQSEGYNLESDMITHFLQKGLKITEMPVTVKYDVPNKHKKNPFSHGMHIMGHIVGVVGYRKPLITFGIPSLILLSIGLISGSWAFTTYYATSKLPYGPSILSALALILGLLMMTSALILNSIVQIIRMENN